MDLSWFSRESEVSENSLRISEWLSGRSLAGLDAQGLVIWWAQMAVTVYARTPMYRVISGLLNMVGKSRVASRARPNSRCRRRAAGEELIVVEVGGAARG